MMYLCSGHEVEPSEGVKFPSESCKKETVAQLLCELCGANIFSNNKYTLFMKGSHYDGTRSQKDWICSCRGIATLFVACVREALPTALGLGVGFRQYSFASIYLTS